MLGEGDLRLVVMGLEPLLAPRLMSPLLGEAGRFTDSRTGAGRLGLDQTGDIDIIVSSELGGVSFLPGPGAGRHLGPACL